MQTFLPYPDYVQSAACLDRLRLGSQRNEAVLILEILLGKRPNSGWKSHSIVRMWDGHAASLCLYALAVCDEWMKRGYRDSVRSKVLCYWVDLAHVAPKEPHWLGREEVHSAYRAALLYKAPEYYKKFGWKEEPGIHYVWEI